MADLNEKATFDHASLKGAESTVEQTPEESEATKKLLRKCDLRLIPPLMVIFFLSFMDRTNIGNAKIQGMTEDLKMTGSDYNMALFVFFIPYIIFEVPSNQRSSYVNQINFGPEVDLIDSPRAQS